MWSWGRQDWEQINRAGSLHHLGREGTWNCTRAGWDEGEGATGLEILFKEVLVVGLWAMTFWWREIDGASCFWSEDSIDGKGNNCGGDDLMNAVWDTAMGMSRLLHYLAVVGYVARGSEVWGNNYLKLLDYMWKLKHRVNYPLYKSTQKI